MRSGPLTNGSRRAVRVDDLPAARRSAKQKRLVPAAVYLPTIRPDRCAELDVSQRPRELAFHVSLNIAELEIQSVQRFAFRLDVVLDKVSKTLILAARVDKARPVLAEKMRVKWRAVGVFPSTLDGVNDRLDLGIILIRPGSRCNGGGNCRQEEYGLKYDSMRIHGV